MRKAQSNNKGSELNERQALFVKHYLTSFNATRAAIEAGYSEKGAEVTGSKLLRNTKVEKLINAEMGRLRERLSEDANKIYAGLWQEVNEITEKINEHYKAEKAIKSLTRDKNAVLLPFGVAHENQLESLPRAIAEPAYKEVLEINFKLQEAQLDILGTKDFLRAQELRAKLLHDLFDRAGYKPTDKINLEHNVSGGIDLSYMTDEELKKEAEILQ